MHMEAPVDLEAADFNILNLQAQEDLMDLMAEA